MADAVIDAGDDKAKKNTKEPKNTKLTQQELPACKPVLQAYSVMAIFGLIGLIMIPVGVICLIYGLKPIDLVQRYDDICFPAGITTNAQRQAYIWTNAENNAALTCTVKMTVTETMKAPIYVYYELNGFYQNHRRYVKSRSDQQLVNTSGDTSTCDPEEFYADNHAELINPCGLIAWSYFNDTYDMSVSSQGTGAATALSISSQGIAYQSDVKHRYSDYYPSYFNNIANASRGGGNITGTVGKDERFITWMRLAALPRFRKLWGRISVDLQKGDVVSIDVINRYNTYSFSGRKSVALSTTTWLGSHNPFLGIAYLITGVVSWVMAIVFFILSLVFKRKFGDLSLLSINQVGR